MPPCWIALRNARGVRIPGSDPCPPDAGFSWEDGVWCLLTLLLDLLGHGIDSLGLREVVGIPTPGQDQLTLSSRERTGPGQCSTGRRRSRRQDECGNVGGPVAASGQEDENCAMRMESLPTSAETHG